jgi:hypothetical protein
MTDNTPASPTSRVIVQRVACDWRRAYALAADPLRLPDWASGLANSALRRDGDHWVATTPQGAATLRFAPANAFGVLDHWVRPEGAEEIYLPFRVIDAGEGACEFQFTLFRQPHMDDAAFAHDAAWIARDLQSLRQLLEPA